MRAFSIALTSLLLSGCFSVEPYIKPESGPIAEIRLPRAGEDEKISYNIGELGINTCVANMKPVRALSYEGGDSVYVPADRAIVIRVNMKNRFARCHTSKAMKLEPWKAYEAIPRALLGCSLSIAETESGEHVAKIKTQSVVSGCLRSTL